MFSSLRLASNSNIPNLLLKLDEQPLTTKIKIGKKNKPKKTIINNNSISGLLYCHSNQTTEEEMYNNNETSQNFQDFLNFLGNRVRLKNYQKYSGGLDTKDDTTGYYSYVREFENYEIMFHVSVLLPWSSNRQQIQRKRHIG